MIGNLPDCSFYYSVKSCSNLAILNILRSYDTFGVDVVSQGEVLRSLKAGYSGDQIVFAGVGKTIDEITFALNAGVYSFHVESVSELYMINKIATSLNKVASVALRINPDIKVSTHTYIQTGKYEDKFGISPSAFVDAISLIGSSKHLKLIGLQCHLGSQITEIDPYILALDALILLWQNLEDKSSFSYISLGGGLAVNYNLSLDDSSADVIAIQELGKRLAKYKRYPFQISFEPGRYIAAHAGLLLSQVTYLKPKDSFCIAIMNAGMTELIRPALYQAVHPILPLIVREGNTQKFDFVGPVCESGDFFAKGVDCSPIQEGDYLAILHTGAYASSMSFNYNTRRLIPEVLCGLDGSITVIRRPQTYDELLSLENF